MSRAGAAAKLLTRDEARRIAANIAKLPRLLAPERGRSKVKDKGRSPRLTLSCFGKSYKSAAAGRGHSRPPLAATHRVNWRRVVTYYDNHIPPDEFSCRAALCFHAVRTKKLDGRNLWRYRVRVLHGRPSLLPFQGISQHQDQFKTLADKRSIHAPPSSPAWSASRLLEAKQGREWGEHRQICDELRRIAANIAKLPGLLLKRP
jgi:hypothetical protein